MRLLVVSNTPFLPADAGNRQRMNRMIEELGARGAEVGMLMLPDPAVGRVDAAGMTSRLAFFESARPPGARARTVARRIASRARRLIRPSPENGPVGVDDWCPVWFRRRVGAVVRAWHPDAVLVLYVFLSACLDHVRDRDRRVLRLIDAQDVMHARSGAYATAGVAEQWFRTSREEERRGLLRADVVLAINPAEADVFRQMVPERQVLVVPHGEPVHPARLDEAEPARLLLVASHNDLNVAGLRWFLDGPWPAVRAALPGAELVVCGNVAEKMAEVPAGVSLRGFVPSLGDEYARARVVINPVRGGTGLKIKLVEALCHARPVVTTSAGADGIDAAAGGVVLADDPPGFAHAIRRLCEDDPGWRRAAAAAGSHAARTFAPRAAFAPLVDLLERSASEPR